MIQFVKAGMEASKYRKACKEVRELVRAVQDDLLLTVCEGTVGHVSISIVEGKMELVAYDSGRVPFLMEYAKYLCIIIPH